MNSKIRLLTVSTKFEEKGITKFDMTNIFYELSDFDDDLNGNNGDEYLWDIAENNGFETNIDFLVNRVLDGIGSDEILSVVEVHSLLEQFFDMWSTYDDIFCDECDFTFNVINNVLFVAVAVLN